MIESTKPVPHTMIYVFSIVHLIHDLYTGVWLLALTSQVAQLDLSYTQAGMVQAVYTLTTALTQPLYGRFFDKSGKPFLAIWSIVLTTVMVTVVAMAHVYWLIVAGAIGAGLGSAAFHAAGLSSARQLAAGRGTGSATAIFLLGGNAGFALGAFIGGRILDGYGATMLTLPAALIVFATPFFLRVLQPYLIGLTNESTRTTRQIFQDGRKTLFPLVIYIAVVLIYQTYWSGFAVFLPQFFESQGKSLNYAGTFTSIYLIFAAFGSLLGGTLSDYFSRRLVAVVSMILIAPLSYGLLRSEGVMVGVFGAILGLCTNMSLPILLIIGQEVFPGGKNTAGGFSFGLTFFVRAFTTPILGYAGDHVGLFSALGVAGFVPLLAVLLFIWLPRAPAHAFQQN